jgi:hypothetical protein
MRSARSAERAFFPLDEELALLPGTLTPSLQEDLVRLGAWMPFGRAGQELAHFRQVDVSRSTVARLTEAAGAAYVAFQTAEVARIARQLPVPPPGPEQLLLSVDGAMVPLVGGEWAEVKSLVVGEVQPAVLAHGELVVHTTQHSYFSRLADAETFQQQALVEVHQRGVETAQAVAAVADGAEWIQKFVDQHRFDALRILDFPHAGGYIRAIGHAVWGEGSTDAQTWLAEQLHRLKHTGPTAVLAELTALVNQQPAAAELTKHLAYLEKRTAHMQYPAFRQAGWPIGSGAVESGNKLVVEARLKGSGMHWRRDHVDPMLALRNIVCSDRWPQAWPQICTPLRQPQRQHRTARHTARRVRTSPPAPSPCPPPGVPRPALRPTPTPAAVETPAAPWRPPANHPWRHMPVGRARFRSTPKPHAKS